MNTVDAVLFDLDGTLIDTAPDLIDCLNTLLKELNKPKVGFEKVRYSVSGGFEAMIKAALGQNIDLIKLEELKIRYLDIYQNNLSKRSRLFDGMEKLLQTLEEKGLCWGIVTNKPGYLTDPLMQQMGLAHRCCAIISADTTAHKKPHPEPLFEASRQCKVSAKNCIYIGDDARDIEAGNAAGMKSLAASWGYHFPIHSINDWPAAGIINHPSQVLDWIR